MLCCVCANDARSIVVVDEEKYPACQLHGIGLLNAHVHGILNPPRNATGSGLASAPCSPHASHKGGTMDRTTQTAAPPEADVVAHDHGSIWTLHFRTEAGKEWRAEHLPGDALTWGVDGVVVEPRYVGAILEGAHEDGLAVRRG